MSDVVQRWADSGLAWLTGMPEEADFSRAPVLDAAQRLAAQITTLLGVGIAAATTLTAHAALAGLRRGGQISAGGASRLLRSRDGWCAVTLSGPEDRHAVAAVVECDGDAPDDPWPPLAAWAATRDAAEVRERCCLLELPVAILGEATAPAVTHTPIASPADGRALAGLVVADLTSMWAGPLCGQLFAAAGATVIKVESPSRPDGTRAGEPEFFDILNAGKLSCAADFDRDATQVRQLLSVADIVLEGSRPRSLARRGLSADQVAGPPGRIWMRLTGHGAGCDRAAFGDDAAVAGGLVGTSPHGPVFCADAVADPLTGLQAALAVAESLGRGGGELIDVTMAGVAAHYAALPTIESHCTATPLAPRQPPVPAAGPRLGADNGLVAQIISERLC